MAELPQCLRPRARLGSARVAVLGEGRDALPVGEIDHLAAQREERERDQPDKRHTGGRLQGRDAFANERRHVEGRQLDTRERDHEPRQHRRGDAQNALERAQPAGERGRARLFVGARARGMDDIVVDEARAAEDRQNYAEGDDEDEAQRRVWTHRDQRGHLHIDEKDHRSEQAEIQTPELHLGGVHRSGVPGRHDAQGHRGDDAADQYERRRGCPRPSALRWSRRR